MSISTIDPNALYDARGAAAVIPGMSTGGLAQHRHRGTGPAYIQHVPNGKVIYLGKDLLAWLDAGRRVPQDAA